MKERRRWRRYRLQSSTKIRARIEESGTDKTPLYTLSSGGCSFLSNRSNAKLLQKPRIQISLKLRGQEVSVPGVVHYCQLWPSKGMDLNLLGVEFDWPDTETQEYFEALIAKEANEGYLESA